MLYTISEVKMQAILLFFQLNRTAMIHHNTKRRYHSCCYPARIGDRFQIPLGRKSRVTTGGCTMSHAEIASVLWEGIPALEMRAGGKKALVLPAIGGNVLSFTDGQNSWIRTPRSLEEYLTLPEAFGIPVLFPPNHIEGGRFSARGIEYQLPMNKSNGTQHLHGFLFNRPWQVNRISGQGESAGATNGGAELEMSFSSEEGGEVYRWFPHPFKSRLSYRLEEWGLFQRISFENLGSTPMPMMLGFHTAFALTDRAGDPESYRISISLGDELKGSKTQSPEKPYVAFRSGRVLKKEEKVFGHFYADPLIDFQGQSGHEAIIENLKTGKQLRYIIDGQYQFWTIWNQGGDDSFICIEPQTCAIDAANMHQEKDLFGFRMLQPRETFTAQCAFL
jgi:aldose 1-epimerase